MAVGIVNSGFANIGSLIGTIKSLNFNYKIVETIKDFIDVNSIILPGVGNFKECKKHLDDKGFSEQLVKEVKDNKKPLLGICIGMQLLGSRGFEGSLESDAVKGLNLIEGEIVSLRKLNCKEKLPHIGWNNLNCVKEDILTKGIENNTDFYFVHSYAFSKINKNEIIAKTSYGIDFPVVIRNGLVWGTQFHPEKSSKYGKQILKNFLEFKKC